MIHTFEHLIAKRSYSASLHGKNTKAEANIKCCWILTFLYSEFGGLESAELIRAQNNSQYIQQRMKGGGGETRVSKICYKRMKMCFLILNFCADAQKVDR